MTKLFQWLLGFSLFLGVWAVLVSQVKSSGLSSNSELIRHVILFLPFYALVAFGVISLAIILYRVYTFNDCQDAAAELKDQIAAAKEDLRQRGLKIE